MPTSAIRHPYARDRVLSDIGNAYRVPIVAWLRTRYNRPMKHLAMIAAFTAALCVSVTRAQSPSSGPYKVLKTAKVGGDGGFDYIYADVAARRLYIPRGGT